jgi:hypothetical protein
MRPSKHLMEPRTAGFCEEKQAPIQRQQRVSRAAFPWQAGSCRRQDGVVLIRPMSDAALTSEIRAVLAASPFHNEGHRKLRARFTPRRNPDLIAWVLRLMRENDLLAPSRIATPRGPSASRHWNRSASP